MAARFSDEGQPYYGFAKSTPSGPRWTGEVGLVVDHLADPLKWRKPTRIFVNSMSDTFHEKLSNQDIAAIFGIMSAASQHTFQVLTKRPKRMREWFAWIDSVDYMRSMPDGESKWDSRAFVCWQHAKKKFPALESSHWDTQFSKIAHTTKWPLENVWLGTSVENQEAANERIPELLATPAGVRFLSCEPLLSRVSLAEWLLEPTGNFRTHDGKRQVELVENKDRGLSWVIAGAESGRDARPCEVSWLRQLRDECKVANASFFLKQARAASEGGMRLYPSIHAGQSSIVDVVTAGEGSRLKPGGIIELPYLDGKNHVNFPK